MSAASGTNPYVARAHATGRRLLARAGGALRVQVTRPTDGDGHDAATDAYAGGVPRDWTVEGYWSTAGQTPAEAATGGSLTGQRVLMVFGRSLGANPDLAPDDVVAVPGEARTYALTAVTPVGAPGGGRAPLYRCASDF